MIKFTGIYSKVESQTDISMIEDYKTGAYINSSRYSWGMLIGMIQASIY